MNSFLVANVFANRITGHNHQTAKLPNKISDSTVRQAKPITGKVDTDTQGFADLSVKL